ncbi:MAG TPA: hypothetical protein VHD35_13810 [Chitinophagaceae bacterium]|nr:hypothetical protein [Chitinophagaceae bacterium]
MPIRKLPILFSLVSISCFGYSQNKSIKEIAASSDSTQKFSLYLPNSYSVNNKYPLIIFLDPAARGSLPVSLYSTLADKYNIILAGSFNSRNFDNNSSGITLKAIYNELIPSYPIDTGWIFLAGFSGGARAASQFAIENKRYFHGIIACGAGFSDQQISPDFKIPYAAIVGNKDMNYSELLEVNHYLDSIRNDNILIITESGHDWPPVEYMELAIIWLLEKKINPGLLSELKNKWLQYSEKKIAVDSGYATYFAVKQLSRILSFKPEIDSLLRTIPQSKVFEKDKRKFEGSIEEENNYYSSLINNYTKAVSFINIDSVKEEDWDKLLRQIRVMKRSKDKYLQLAGTRCQDKSFRLCVEYAIVLLRTNQYVEAYNTAHVGTFFAPDNFNLPFFMAQAAAGFNDKKLARENLNTSIHKGMTNPSRAITDPLLLKVFSKEELEKLFEK